MQKKKKPLVTQTAGQRQIRDPLLTLFLPCLPVSLSLFFFMLCTSLFLGYLFSFDFFFFPPTSLSLRMTKKKKMKPLGGTNSPAALRTRNVSVRCHCVPAGRGRRTDERRRAPQTKQRLTQFTKLREPARQGCLEPFLRREAPPCCVDQQEQPSDINVLMPSTTPSRPASPHVIFTHPPPPAGQALVELPLRCTPVLSLVPSSVGSAARWTVAADFPRADETAVATPPLVARTRASKATSSTSRCCHLCTQLHHSFTEPLLDCTGPDQENTICGRFKNSATT